MTELVLMAYLSVRLQVDSDFHVGTLKKNTALEYQKQPVDIVLKRPLCHFCISTLKVVELRTVGG